MADWDRDGARWPNRESSRFVVADGLRWHVQQMGEGRPLLLVHGTGASTHSWRDLAPALAASFAVVAVDLPGHAFTPVAAGDGMSLNGMSRRLAGLLAEIGVRPALAVGHSAGAAIVVRATLDRAIAPAAIVSLNGAFVPFGGALRFLSPIARMMAATPLAARVFAARARNPRAVANLLESTGSTLDAKGAELYARLVRDPDHVHGALAMMASWQLEPLAAAMTRLDVPMLFVVGGNDRTVPPAQAEVVAARMANARVERLAGLGHLAHEEDPARVARLIVAFARAVSPPAAAAASA